MFAAVRGNGLVASQSKRSAAGGRVIAGIVEGEVVTRPVVLNADATWAMTLDVDTDGVRTVALVGGDGRVWCEARFESPASGR